MLARLLPGLLLLLAALGAEAAPRAGRLVLRTPVEGAEVTVDGRGRGHTPLAPLALPAGNRDVRVRRPGLIDVTRTVQVRAGEEVVLNALPDRPASLLTIEGPAGVEALLDGRSIGKLPLREVPIEPGRHVLILRQRGLRPHKEEFTARPHRVFELQPTLVRQDGTPLETLAGLDLDLAPLAPIEAEPALDLEMDLAPLEPLAAEKPAQAVEKPPAFLEDPILREAEGDRTPFYANRWMWSATAGAVVTAVAIPLIAGRYREVRDPSAVCPECVAVINR